MRRAIGARLKGVERDRVRYNLAVAGADLGQDGQAGVVALITDDSFSRAWDEGARLTPEQAIAEALADDAGECLPVDLLEESFDACAEDQVPEHARGAA